MFVVMQAKVMAMAEPGHVRGNASKVMVMAKPGQGYGRARLWPWAGMMMIMAGPVLSMHQASARFTAISQPDRSSYARATSSTAVRAAPPCIKASALSV